MNTLLAITIGKSIRYASRVFKLGGGSAAPGLYALKADPNLIKNLSKQIPTNIVITGTNGKTTTARLLAHFLKNSGKKIVHNSTGSNLERGIASTLLSHVNIFGKIQDIDAGIWELDEAAFNTVAPKLNPKIVLFLNAFRDQLDRYGEVDSVLKNWQKTIDMLKGNPTFVINTDDGNTQELSGKINGKKVTFGLENQKITGEKATGKKITPNFEATDIKLNQLAGTKFKIKTHDSEFIIQLPIPGIYHIYDFLGAFIAGIQLGLEPQKMIESLESFSPAFGRMEKVQLGKNNGYIFLIKNPVGATQVFETIAPNIKSNDKLLIALNDNFADGTDVSWIWDVNFELFQNSSRALVKLGQAQSRDLKIYVSGTRAYDLAVRLKYAGFSPNSLEITPSLQSAFNKAKSGLKGNLFILPTYTAMLNIQHILAKSGIKKEYWEEA